MSQPAPAHEQVLIAIRKIIRSIDLHSRQLIQRHNLTGPQLIILRKLEAVGEAAIGDLAEAVSLSHPTVTGIIARLEKRGFIVRIRGERDKRQFLVHLSDEGRKVLEKAPPLLRENFTKEFAKLVDWEQMQILSSLHRVVELMEAQDLEAAPYLINDHFADRDVDGEPLASGARGGRSKNKNM